MNCIVIITLPPTAHFIKVFAILTKTSEILHCCYHNICMYVCLSLHIILLYVGNKCWCQLPEDGHIKLKHV